MERIPEPEVMDRPGRAAAYARADFADVNDDFVARLAAFPGAGAGGLVVDLGPGPGDLLFRAAERIAGRFVGVEASPVMVRLAESDPRRRPLGQRVAYVLGDVKAAPVASGAADVVMANSVLHHLPAPQPFWDEVRRLVKPGGAVYVRDLRRPVSVDAAAALVAENAADEPAILREEFYNSLLAAFTAAEVREQLRAAGLTALEVTCPTDRHVDVVGSVR